MGSITALVRRDPLISFLVLAFALSWGLGAVLNGNGLLAPNASFILGVPIAALVVIALTEGRAGLKDLGRRIVQVRAAPRWYAVVFALPIVVLVAVLALLPLFGGARSTGPSTSPDEHASSCWGSSWSSRSRPRSPRRSAGAVSRSPSCSSGARP